MVSGGRCSNVGAGVGNDVGTGVGEDVGAARESAGRQLRRPPRGTHEAGQAEVGELLRNIRNLPPAEKNDAGEYEHEEEQEEREQQKAEQNEKQEEANPYEVGRV